MVKYVPIYCFFSDYLVKLYGGIAWSPDGTRLVAVTYSGSVIQVTNNKAHSTVYKINTGVCIMFAALSLLIPCLVVWMRIQSQWDRCRRWRRQSSDTVEFIQQLFSHSNIDWIVKLCALVNDHLLLLTRMH